MTDENGRAPLVTDGDFERKSWSIIGEIMGVDTSTVTGREKVRTVFRFMTELNAAKERSTAAAVRWLIAWTGAAVAGLIFLAIDRNHPVISGILRKLGMHP